MKTHFITLLVLLFFLSLNTHSQRVSINFIIKNNDHNYPKKNLKKISIKDKRLANKVLQERYFQWIDDGYFQTKFEIDTSSSNWLIYVVPGLKFSKIHLEIPEKEPLLRQNLPYRIPKNQTEILVTRNQLSNLLNLSLKAYLDNGFPLVSISLVDFRIEDDKISCLLNLDKGLFLEWKQIVIKGDTASNSKIFEQLSGIKTGTPYSESLYQKLPRRLNQFAFLDNYKSPELLFTPQGVDLYVYVKQKKISSIQGAIGLQPNPITGQVALTGEFQTKLWNVFRRAEQLDFHWRSIQPGTQSLNIKFNYPFLLRSPFGIEGRFQLYKRDSTFLELQSFLSGTYTFKDGAILKLNYQNWSSNILSGGLSNQQLASTSTNFYGLSYQRRYLDYFPNPSKGNAILLSASLGNRNVTRQETTTQSNVWRIQLQSSFYIPIYKRHVIKLALNVESYNAPEIFVNERLRFGGLNSFRGFNEDELNATTLSIATLEYRFLVDKNSNAFLFFDQGIYEDRSLGYKKDNPFSVGTGFSFGSRLGIFTISYAIGKQLQNPFNFREGKIHFGYSAFF